MAPAADMAPQFDPHPLTSDNMEELPNNIRSLNRLLISEDICADDCIPVRILGQGAMATVLLAVHRQSKSPFALKAMSKETMIRRRSLRRAQNEIDILEKLQHPFLPTLHSHFESTNYNFLVLDYCSGGDLNALRHRQPEKRFSEAAIRFYGAELVMALEYLHGLGIVYRDLKPENLLISDGGHVVLTDFDLSLRGSPQTRTHAKLPEEASHKVIKHSHRPSFLLSCFGEKFAEEAAAISCMPIAIAHSRNARAMKDQAGALPSLGAKDGSKAAPVGRTAKYFVGTEEYVAPEILLGKGHDFAVDWWSLGILLYELLYGKSPFKGLNRKATFSNILHKEPVLSGPWSPLQDLIRKLLEKEPSRRLGFSGEAVELKEHVFFKGVQWDSLQHVARAPVVPESMCMQEMMRKGNQVNVDLETYLEKVEARLKGEATPGSRMSSERSSDEETIDSSDFEDSFPAHAAMRSSRSKERSRSMEELGTKGA